MSSIKSIHLIGIGGAGMSGIAEILHNQNYSVSGSDLEDTNVTKRLKNLGVKIFKGHKENNVLKKDLVVISSAISKKNVELKKAISMGIPVIPRAEMLANLMMLKNSIAVAGSHGKTTVTCIMAHIFTEAGLDPTYIIGGKVKSFESNAKLGLGEHIIAEADESDGSFLNLRPLKALVTNIDNDHLGTYGNDFNNLKKSFKKFCLSLPFQGYLIANGDDPSIKNIIKNIPRNSFSFGKDKSNDYQIKDIKQNIRGTSFKLKDNFVKKDYSFSMSMHGEHNVMNATSAIIAAIQENIDLSIIKKSLKTCSSIERRFEIVSHDIFSKKITLVDDYGHHPKEIKYSYDTASEIWKNKKKIVVFQPHRYTRTKDLFDEFIKTLLNIENLLLLDIYPASEKIIKGYEGKDLFQALKKNGSNVVFCQNHTEVIEKLENMTTGNEVIITQGAGTTSDLARKISNL
ncbi:UDP-N-acetylmuramate--L-alanine ligase [SAR86 cluster bacterium]|jgi:UDP-N-acetylmuramate--alanine ligase|nr:UDP-N-acetylmuramate--L-alanine ligase [SAR86 cluster bacterium]GIR51884.1 MAG: UDP-N-acetylmuramate--L-alanine ligase [Gammaproteobacteria bacterium]|tara:strand:- start:21 stop:1394 length:1374 start_codon:yes stop_codon:yes gene_type:complete